MINTICLIFLSGFLVAFVSLKDAGSTSNITQELLLTIGQTKWKQKVNILIFTLTFLH